MQNLKGKTIGIIGYGRLGKMMYNYQAHQAFAIWHKILPNIDEETIKLLD